MVEPFTVVRLRLALDIASRIEDPTDLLPEIQRDLDFASAQIVHEPVFPSALSSVALVAADLGLDVVRFIRQCVDLIEAEAHYVEAWEALAELVGRFGQTHLADRFTELVSACSAWAVAELTFDIEFYGDPDEIEVVLDVAERFDVTVPADIVAAARARLELSDATPVKPAPDRPASPGVAIADEDSMIEHLFASFLTEGAHSILPLLNVLYGRKARW